MLSAAESRLQQLLALLAAPAARLLRLAGEVPELGVVVALRVLDVGVQAQHVVEAGLRVPDDVVGLVLCACLLAGLGCRHCWGLLSLGYGGLIPEQTESNVTATVAEVPAPSPPQQPEPSPSPAPQPDPKGPEIPDEPITPEPQPPTPAQ